VDNLDKTLVDNRKKGVILNRGEARMRKARMVLPRTT
jgi:hypothetical protein